MDGDFFEKMTNKLQLITKEPPKTIIKHIAAVHNSSALTLTQRKISNIFLENALKTISEDKDHMIPVKHLMEAIGWSDSSHVNDDLKENLKGLARIQIEWNILEKDKKNKWVASTLLAHVAIKAGFVYYSYSRALRSLFAQPNVYARLNLDIQKDFNNKYALILWEFIWGDLSSKKEDKIETDWVVYPTLLKLMGLAGSAYTKRFALFKERILFPALTEINEKADILVHFDEKKLGKKTTHMRFIGERKNNRIIDEKKKEQNQINDNLEQQLYDIGLNNRSIQSIIHAYKEDEIMNALAYYTAYSQRKTVENPVAFFKKALQEGWCVPKNNSNNLSVYLTKDDNHLNQELISNTDEDQASQQIRGMILQEIGASQYRSWFLKARFRVIDNHLEITAPSSFIKDHMEIHFSHCLKNIIASGVCGIDSVEIKMDDGAVLV